MVKLINQVVIFVHLKIFLRLLKKSLRLELEENFTDLVVRNSILTPEFYHFLYSDIDLAVVLQDPGFEELTKVRKILVRFKKIYPPMGEVEVYSEEEWEKLKDLKNQVKDLYTSARSIRKYFWMGAPEDDYQGPKRLRALKVILKKLELSGPPPYSHQVIKRLTDLTRNFVKPEDVTGENSFFHTYFTAPFLAPLDHTNSGHRLSASDLVSVAALFPTDDAGYFANKELIEQIHRNQPDVQAARLVLKTIDQLEIKGSQRGRI